MKNAARPRQGAAQPSPPRDRDRDRDGDLSGILCGPGGPRAPSGRLGGAEGRPACRPARARVGVDVGAGVHGPDVGRCGIQNASGRRRGIPRARKLPYFYLVPGQFPRQRSKIPSKVARGPEATHLPMTQWEEESTDEHSLTLTAIRNRLEECSGPPTGTNAATNRSIRS